MREATARRLRGLLLAAVGFHVLFGLARLPHAAWAKRLRLVDAWQRLGPIGFHVGRSWPETAAVLTWLRDHTAPDAVLLFRGHWRGALEFAPALLYPRLLYAESSLPAGAARVDGRPLARGRYPGQRDGVLVLVGDGMHLEVDVR